jgi:hypothetical protein
MSDIDVALSALHSDAKAWHAAGDRLNGPLNAIGALGLTRLDVSMWAADRGLDRTYENARSALSERLMQAAENFHRIGQALSDAADTYQREEEANLHMFNSVGPR